MSERDETPLSPALLKDARRRGTRPTEKELAVLRGLTVPGATLKSVARDLGIRPGSASQRLHALYRRLGVTSAAQALTVAWGDVQPVARQCAECGLTYLDRSNLHRATLEHKFWRGVQKSDGCWEWTRYRLPNGYGRASAEGGGMDYAHRVSWRLHFGEIPSGLYVCHRCDNRSCVRPDHLFLGTHQDNMDDMKAKGRAGRRLPRSAA